MAQTDGTDGQVAEAFIAHRPDGCIELWGWTAKGKEVRLRSLSEAEATEIEARWQAEKSRVP